VYVKVWISYSQLESAPATDLAFLKSAYAYPAVNEGLSNTAVSALRRHLRYISEQLVALSYFADAVNKAVKRRMVAVLTIPASKNKLKRIEIERATIDSKELLEIDIKLNQDYNASMNVNKEQKQFVLQVVSRHSANFLEPEVCSSGKQVCNIGDIDC
jgi:phage-related minor tail protein